MRDYEIPLVGRSGALDDVPFLPRVSVGDCILSRARWNLTDRDLRAVRDTCGVARGGSDARAALRL